MKTSNSKRGDRTEQVTFTMYTFFKQIQKLFLAGLALVLGMLLAPGANAQQSIQIRAQPIRITVSDATTESVTITNLVAFIQDSNIPVAISISGVPAGAGAFTDAATTNQSGFGAHLTVNTTNLTSGEYTLRVIATDTNNVQEGMLPVVLQSGRMWAGDTNVATTWSSATSWVGGNIPGATTDVLFGQIGTQTNAMVVVGDGGFTNTLPFSNSIVDVNREIQSLRFMQTNGGGGSVRHTVLINDGVTLSITGTNGLRLLRDYTTIAGGNECAAYFAGGNGSLVVSNAAANVAVLIDSGNIGRMDMSQLGSFKAVVSRVGLGNVDLYPNFLFLNNSNGFSGNATFSRVRKHQAQVNLAWTNYIKASYADPDNYTNALSRQYTFALGNNANTEGLTSQSYIGLGITNGFFMDSFLVCGGAAQAFSAPNAFSGGLFFQRSLQTNACTAYFRNANGSSRMSVFAIADDTARGEIGNGNTVKGSANFNGGSVDILVDRLYIGLPRMYSQKGSEGSLYMSAGVFDANTVVLGYQNTGNGTNVGYGSGALTVSTTAVFKVNNVLHLGYTTAANGSLVTPQSGQGQITIGPGSAFLMASNILVGGVTKESANNTITIQSGGTLIVSNGVGSSDKMLTTLNLNSNATLTLHLNGLRTEPYLYVSNTATAQGGPNYLHFAQVNNFKLTNTHIPIFQYGPLLASFGASLTITMPAPYHATPWEDTTAKVWGVDISTNPPKNLLWVGNINSLWDTTNKNWKDLTTGIATNFVNGDYAAFDQSGLTKTITLVDTLGSPLVPSGMTMTNTSTYTFTGSGQISGGPALTKYGSGDLAIDAVTSIGATINQGSLSSVSGSARIGSAAIAAGATMTFGGTINAGLSCAGVATFSGNLSGALTVSSGGIVTNLGGTISANAVSMGNGSRLVNSGTLGYAGGVTLGITVTTNSYLQNSGILRCSTLTVNSGGTLKDMGVDAGAAITVTTMTIGSGGTFIPGGDAIGTTRVNSSYVNTISGRVTFSSGSTNVFKVQPSAASQNSTRVLSGYGYGTGLDGGLFDFGSSQSTPLFNGCYLQIVNLDGASAYTNGQVFNFFGESDYLTYLNISPTGSSTNAYPIMQPTPPLQGLAWDFSNLRYMDVGGNNGIIRVIGTATESPVLTYSPSIYYNVMMSSNMTTNGATITTNITSNNIVVSDLSWPATNMGWRLERYDSDTRRGLRDAHATNWVAVFGSTWTNAWLTTNTFVTNQPGSAIFWRMVYP